MVVLGERGVVGVWLLVLCGGCGGWVGCWFCGGLDREVRGILQYISKVLTSHLVGET